MESRKKIMTNVFRQRLPLLTYEIFAFWIYVLGVGLLLGMSSLLIVVYRTPMKDAVPKRLHEVPYNSSIEKPPISSLP